MTALYVKIDDEIEGVRWLGRPPLLSDSELICLAVARALLGYHSEARWLRYAHKLHAGAVRHVAPDPPTIEHGGLGRLRLMAAGIWHNNQTGEPVTRSPTAFDH
ncbi:hypothetical protein [Streptomyces sp. NPDC004134]|uniref:hypothetical protein n=1 Tax=Streptomyces sp. NPDC004134 TaxID=3364691 RepID=UPI0036748D2F